MKRFLGLLLFLSSLCFGQTGYNSFQQTTFTTVTTASTIQQRTTILYHQISWTVLGSPASCSVQVDSSPDGIAWTSGGIIGATTCTANGNSAVTAGLAPFIRVNTTALSVGGTLTLFYKGWSYNPAPAANFTTLGPGTNAGALVVGTGGSLTASGTGQIIGSELSLGLSPQPPTLSVNTTGGNIVNGHPVRVQITYNTAAGETTPSSEVFITAGSCVGTNQCSITVTPPTLPSGVTSYTVYSTDNGASFTEGRQNANNACVAITGSCIIQQGGAGVAVPTVNTAWAQPANMQATTCPPGIMPLAAISKTDGNAYSLYGVDTVTRAPLVAPFGIMEFCQPVFFNDTGIAPIFMKNNMVSFYHQFEAPYLTVGSTVDDRAIGIRTETLPSITGSNHGRFMGVYGEIGIKGTPTAFSSAADHGVVGLRWTVDDSRTGGALSGTPLIALDGSYQDASTGGATSGGCGLICGVGVRGLAISNLGANGATSYVGGVFGTACGGACAGLGIGVLASPPTSTRFLGGNYQLYIDFCPLCAATGDWQIYEPSLTGKNLFGGAVQMGDLYPSQAGTINVKSSLAGASSLSTAQIPALSVDGSWCTQVGTPGATNWVYKFTAVDANGNESSTGAGSCGVANGNATLDTTNYNALLAKVSNPLPASINIYRTTAGGTPNTTGKIANFPLTGIKLEPGATFTSLFVIASDKALTADGTTPPGFNSTGGALVYKVQTLTNCAAVGSAANPSVAACGAAAAGQFSCATNATGATCTINTTAVTINSEIFVQESDTTMTGTRLGVTCNTGTNVLPASRLMASSVAGVSFTINLGTVTTNPACFSYNIVN